MVRIVIETQPGDDNDVAVASRDARASGDAVDGGGGPGGSDVDMAGDAPAGSLDGGAPPAWLTAAIEAAERDGGETGDGRAEASGASDGGAAPRP